jgi:hypothetical protein
MKHLLIIAITVMVFGCGHKNKAKMDKEIAEKDLTKQMGDSVPPSADKFVKSPLRNRIRLELNASVTEVWSLVGVLERMPEYSSGLKKLEAKYDSKGNCTEYTCHFLPEEEGGEVTTHSETMKWYEPNVGYISLAHEPNIVGLQQSLSIISLEKKGNDKTLLRWDVHFTAENEKIIKMNIEGFKQALNIDIAQNLIKLFGGIFLENYSYKI